MFGFLTLGTTLTFVDLAAKAQIEAQEEKEFPRELEGTKGFIWLYRNHNEGFTFGFLQNRPKLVETVPLCMTSGLAGMWIYACSQRGHFMRKLGLTLALAGGMSNLYDRLKRGYVVDYFSIRLKKMSKVVFNLGDMFIIAGTLVFSFAEMIEDITGRRG